MDKNAIKKYAVWARNELIARVTQKAEQYEITEKKTTPAEADSIGGRLLSEAEKKQRAALIEKIKTDGFEQVMEEVAYTWFNRFTALRFMEVNNYLPSHTRVFTNEAGEFKPQILTDAIRLDLEGLNMDKVFELKDANKTEELYKYLLITQCNALSSVLPRMFQKIAHYTELLLPDYLLREGSVIEQMIALIPEEDWTDQVQIIGWLYQYYNSEPKDAVFAALKKNVKISKENIPAATQLFTPDWIVRYMVENSLGRLWLEGHPNDALKSEWKYYLDEAEQEADVQKQLDEIRKEYAELKPEDICCIDPCMGSGHILCYMFDVLVKIYEDYGYTAREAVGNIVEKNLWGIDIDERAAQLSYFAVMMKARQYDRRFLTREIQAHVYAIEESNGITTAPMHDMGIGLSQEEYNEAVNQVMRLVEEFHDAKEYGSLIHITPCNWDLLRRFVVPHEESEWQVRLDIHGEKATAEKLQRLISVGEALSKKYHIVVTNPPYMGAKRMNARLADYTKSSYPKTKSDLFAVFIERAFEMIHNNGYQAMITQHAWMFLDSFKDLRTEILKRTLVNMAHLGTRAFEEIGGEVVQTTAFVLMNKGLPNYKGCYKRLVDYLSQDGKETAFLTDERTYSIKQKEYFHIEGRQFAYWLGNSALELFEGKKIGDYANACYGFITGDNDKYLKLWYEVEYGKIAFTASSAIAFSKSDALYAPCNKGGYYRKWYGNNDYVAMWSKSPEFHRNGSTYQYAFFQEGITWSVLSSNKFNGRYYGNGYVFDHAAASLFVQSNENVAYILGYLNSNVFDLLINAMNPTINTGAEIVAKIPLVEKNDIKDIVNKLVKDNIELCKADWDSFETSWDFREHPFISAIRLMELDGKSVTMRRVFEEWLRVSEVRFNKLKRNEEELNRIFIDLYGLGDVLTSEIEDKDITVCKADLRREVRSFISYAVGCMFGRYTLGVPGLIYAGGKWDESKYLEFHPDEDGIIPICDDEYFEDDIVGQFVEFVEVVFGKETLEENLQFISSYLNGNGSSREIIRNYFINDFYSDHLKVYQKHPIYWLFDSGKKNGFKCLIYLQRYKPDTVARIRTDYVHEQQSRYRTAIADLEERIKGTTASERVKMSKHLISLREQEEEIRIYEEKIHHFADQMIKINLDEGVKKNYALFEDILQKI